jgi:hypothetical protein
MTRLLAIAGLALSATACALDDGEAFGDTLLVPVDVELHWDAAFNATDDGLGAVVPVDLMVYDGTTGEPRDGIALDVLPPADAAILFEGDLQRVAPEDCLDCTLFWDAWRDHYYAVEVDPDFAGSARVTTGAEGLARVYVLVDAFPAADDGFAPAAVRVDAEAASARFQLVPR